MAHFESWADSLSPERDERLAHLGGHDITQVFDISFAGMGARNYRQITTLFTQMVRTCSVPE